MLKKGLIMSLLNSLILGGSVYANNSSLDTVTSEQSELKNPLSNKLENIEEIVQKALETFNIPGSAIGIVVNGEVVLCKGYGVRDQSQNLPVTENTVFAIGSCTKAFTTFVLGQLVDEGLISWDDLVIKHIPEFRLKDPYMTHHVTIRDLVTHRSGLPRHDLLWYNSDFPRKELLDRVQHLEFSADLREKFQYNNIMYGIAGLVIERVAGLTWEEATKERILKPLGMDQTNFSVIDSQKSPDFAQPYQNKKEEVNQIPFRKITNVGPAGSINSTILDMTKWLQLQLGGGRFSGTSLIHSSTLQEMHTIQTPIPDYPKESLYVFGYGLGWMIGMYQGHYFVTHGGGIDGFISNVALLPKDGIGVVVLTNAIPNGGHFTSCVTNTIIDRLLGITGQDWIAKEKELYAKLSEDLPKEDNISKNEHLISPADHYTGSYSSPAYGTIHISLDKDTLMAEFNDIPSKLHHNNFDAFTAYVNDAVVEHRLNFQFIRDSGGEVIEVLVPFENFVTPISFKKVQDSNLFSPTYLTQFVGTYAALKTSIAIVIKNNHIMAVLEDQPSIDLVALKPNVFSFKGVPGNTVEFIKDIDGNVLELVVVNHYGRISFKVTK